MTYQEAKALFGSGSVTDITNLTNYYQNLLNSTDSTCYCKNCGLINIDTGFTATVSTGSIDQYIGSDGITNNISMTYTYLLFNCNNCNSDLIVFT